MILRPLLVNEIDFFEILIVSWLYSNDTNIILIVDKKRPQINVN